MRRHQEQPAECDMCDGNRQLLHQLMNDVAALREAFDREPRIDVAQINPGDVLVITSQNLLHEDQVTHIIEDVKRRFPGVEGIILDGGLHVSVIRPDTPPVRDGGC